MDSIAISTNQTFTLQVLHVGMLADMAEKTGKNKSELVREAIELLFNTSKTIAVTAQTAA